jgi:hypothetical protein
LLLVQSKALDEAPYKLSGAVAKLAGITFWSLASSYWFDKSQFLTEGRLATVLIIPSSWGSQLGGYLPASVGSEKCSFSCKLPSRYYLPSICWRFVLFFLHIRHATSVLAPILSTFFFAEWMRPFFQVFLVPPRASVYFILVLYILPPFYITLHMRFGQSHKLICLIKYIYDKILTYMIYIIWNYTLLPF